MKHLPSGTQVIYDHLSNKPEYGFITSVRGTGENQIVFCRFFDNNYDKDSSGLPPLRTTSCSQGCLLDDLVIKSVFDQKLIDNLVEKIENGNLSV